MLGRGGGEALQDLSRAVSTTRVRKREREADFTAGDG